MRMLLLTLLALSLGSVPAKAATGSLEVPRLPGSTVPLETIPTIAGPVPAGGAVAFGSGSSGRGWKVVVAVPGAGARDVATVAPQEASTLDLRASATRLALLRFARVCRGRGCHDMQYDVTLDETLAGPLAGPFAKLACVPGSACGSGSCGGSFQDGHGAALGGDLLAVRSCQGASATLVDLATGVSRPLGPAVAVAVAGRLAAVTEPSGSFGVPARIVVRDALSGAEIYRPVPPAASVVPAAQLALVADGSVFYTSPAGSGLALVAASPAAPAGHVLRTVPTSTAIIGAGPAGVLLLTSRGRLELVSLDGSSSRALELPDLVGAPAFDGATITWAQRTCVTTAIVSWRLGDQPPQAPDLRCPTLRPSRSAVTLPRNRRLRVQLSCPATGRGGCAGRVRLTAERRGRTPRGRNGAERRYRLGAIDVALDPGERQRVAIGVRSGAARWVRRHSRLRLRIDATSDVQRSAQRPAGDRGSVSRTVRLRSAIKR